MHPVKVAGPRLLLREFRADDVDGALALVGDDAVTKWLSFDSRTRAQAAAMIDGVLERATLEPRTEYYLAVVLADGPEDVLGFVRLGLDGIQAAKLGYAIRADAWGHGYATECAALMVAFGFEQLGLHRISAAIGPDNAASIRVVQHLGFVHEGRIRDHVFTNGAWRDSELYSILRSEWAAVEAA